MVLVFGRKDDVIKGDTPVDGQVGIVPGNGSLAFRMVEIVAFVLENGIFGENYETMGKTFGDKKHQVVIGGQFTSHALTVGRGVSADVNSHIKNSSTDFRGCARLFF